MFVCKNKAVSSSFKNCVGILFLIPISHMHFEKTSSFKQTKTYMKGKIIHSKQYTELELFNSCFISDP